MTSCNTPCCRMMDDALRCSRRQLSVLCVRYNTLCSGSPLAHTSKTHPEVRSLPKLCYSPQPASATAALPTCCELLGAIATQAMIAVVISNELPLAMALCMQAHRCTCLVLVMASISRVMPTTYTASGGYSDIRLPFLQINSTRLVRVRPCQSAACLAVRNRQFRGQKH